MVSAPLAIERIEVMRSTVRKIVAGSLEAARSPVRR